MVLGAVLALVGVLGFVNNPIIYLTGAIFGANMLQSVVHILGGVGLYFGMKGGAKTYNLVVGVIAALLAVLWFVPPTMALLKDNLAVNANITYLHVAIALVSLGVAFGVKE